MNETVMYKRTIKGSVGAGMGALFNGSGKQYYVLVHKNASKYHSAGESQKIIVDQAELGRASNCQVRFDDEQWPMVSRNHAAIEKDANGWKIIPLSQTNSTLVNGRAIDSAWNLQNGDEIQLAKNGPKLGFIIPAGKQSLVSSIKLTERLNLFRQQALRPYKTAIACLFALLVVSCSAAGIIIHNQSQDISALLSNEKNQKAIIADMRKNWENDSIEKAKEIASIKKGNQALGRKIRQIEAEKNLSNSLEQVESSVYAVITKVYILTSNEKQSIGETSLGTGFLLNDGRFVTARHCVEPWMYDGGKLQLAKALANESNGEIEINAEIVAVNSKNEQFTFSSRNFQIDRTYDTNIEIPFELEGKEVSLTGTIAMGSKASLGNDWAYVQTNKKGSIIDGKDFSDKLKKGTTVHLLGFPKGLGINDGEKFVEPMYNKLEISRDGLNDSRCIMVNDGVDHGNSGGPVFILDNGQLKVIGIVSRGDHQSELYNHLVPMCNLK